MASSSSAPKVGTIWWRKHDYMNPAIWGTLPHEVTSKVLACLPLHDFLRFRSVCKRWNSLFDDTEFRKSFIRKPYEAAFLIPAMNVNGFPETYGGLNVVSRTWHSPFPPFMSSRLDAKLLEIAGGLVLWMTGKVEATGGQAVDNRKLFVSNPLTKAERQLPPMSAFRQTKELDNLYAVFALDADNSEYSILIVHVPCVQIDDFIEWDWESDMETEVYSSRNNCWESRGTMPTSGWHSISSIVSNEELYCLCTSLSRDGEPSLYRVHNRERNIHNSSSFWTKMDLHWELTDYYHSSFLYRTGPTVHVATVTESLGNTMVNISLLQIAQGGTRCTVHKVYTQSIPASEMHYHHSVCATDTHVFYLRSPGIEEYDPCSILLVLGNTQSLKDLVGEDERPELPFVEFFSVDLGLDISVAPKAQWVLYEPRFDLDV